MKVIQMLRGLVVGLPGSGIGEIKAKRTPDSTELIMLWFFHRLLPVKILFE